MTYEIKRILWTAVVAVTCTAAGVVGTKVLHNDDELIAAYEEQSRIYETLLRYRVEVD